MDGRLSEKSHHDSSSAATACELRLFHLGDILSVTTGSLVSPTMMNGIHKIINWMTGDNIVTHEITRAQPICARSLMAQLPFTAAIAFPRWLNGDSAGAQAWLKHQVADHGEFHPVYQLTAGEWTPSTIAGRADELISLMPQADTIIVIAPDEPAGAPYE